jgi:hypothetical protein
MKRKRKRRGRGSPGEILKYISPEDEDLVGRTGPDPTW